jgi:hypothetical protein
MFVIYKENVVLGLDGCTESYRILKYLIEASVSFWQIVDLGPMLLNFLQLQFTNVHNKQECLSLASLPYIVKCL